MSTGGVLPIDSEPARTAPPPLSLRTDSMGVFAVLGLSGLAQLFTGRPEALQSVLPTIVGFLWMWTLIIAGFAGLAATLVPSRWRIYGMAGEAVARVALGLGSVAYGLVILEYRGWTGAGFSVLVFVGIGLMMLVGAVQLARWLHLQRQVVTVVMHFQAGEAVVREEERVAREHDDDEHGGAQ